MKTPELKPYPFCGGKASLNSGFVGVRNPDTWYQVECENEQCAIRPFTDHHKSKSAVVKEWNRRVKEDENA